MDNHTNISANDDQTYKSNLFSNFRDFVNSPWLFLLLLLLALAYIYLGTGSNSSEIYQILLQEDLESFPANPTNTINPVN